MRERGRLVRVFCAVFIIISVLSMMQQVGLDQGAPAEGSADHEVVQYLEL